MSGFNKDFLKGKVLSGGVLNQRRAIFAADYARSATIDESMVIARTKVQDLADFSPTAPSTAVSKNKPDVTAIEMPSGFTL